MLRKKATGKSRSKRLPPVRYLDLRNRKGLELGAIARQANKEFYYQ